MNPHRPPWQERVLDFLDGRTDEIVASLRSLVQIPSVSGSDEENDISARLALDLAGTGMEVDHWQVPLGQTLAAADFPGVEVDRREAWGLVGRSPGRGEGQSLMLNAHVDVVPVGDRESWDVDPFAGSGDARSVHGRGTCDMKGGLVAALWAVRALRTLDVPLRGDLLLACVQGEEDGGLGTYATLTRGWRADACIIPEPTSLDVVPANGGALTFRLRVTGLATHASRRTDGVSAVEKFWPVFSGLRRLEEQRNLVTDPLMSRWEIAYPIEIGRVHAGDWSSSVPGSLVAEGRLGVALGEPPQLAREQLHTAVALVCAADPWLRDHPVQVEWWGGQFASGATDLDAPIIAAVRRAHRLVSGATQRTWGAPYGSDLRLMTELGGIPTVQYGPGDASLAHGPRERVPVAEVLTSAGALALAAIDHCGV